MDFKLFRTHFKQILLKQGYQISKVSPANLVNNQKESFSQSGEDLIIDYIFKLRNINTPSYLDVGAHDPFYLNNTAIFYQRGCRGINIEANHQLAESFKIYRPDDINLNMGVSIKEEARDFYIMADNTLSTFCKTEYDLLIDKGKKLKEIRPVKSTTIQSVLDTHCNGAFPDLLSIDVEGMDLQILKSINFLKSFPKVICVEASEFSITGAGARRCDIIDYLTSVGYYEYANTNINAIMVKRDFWFI